MLNPNIIERVRAKVDRDRLLQTAIDLIAVPSPTRSAAAVSDCLAEILKRDGFPVERVEAGWPEAPAVAARLDTGRPGRVLQFNGHLDTVHLPFVPPRVEGGTLYGSGSSDMKGGIAATVEAMRVLRDEKLLPAGGVLLTAHDLHESPWGDGHQVDGLIDAGYVGDAVLLPEYLCDRLPVIGRGLAVVEFVFSREGTPVHEVLGGIEQPSVIAAGAELVRRLGELDCEVAPRSHPMAGRESFFIGQVHSGEIYNQSPVEFRLSGTRRWLPGTDWKQAEARCKSIAAEVAKQFGVKESVQFQVARDAFELDESHPFVGAFQESYVAVAGGPALPRGPKPFVDDGNTFVARGKVPAITHGPNAKGAHTLKEEVPVDELVRVAATYALTAIAFCNAD